MRLLKRTTALAGVLSLATVASLGAYAANNQNSEWMTYEANDEANHFSALSQINRSNVTQLKPAWQYVTEGGTQANPLVIDGVMYVIGSKGTVVAVDATNGKQKWESQPKLVSTRLRGLIYWQSKDGKDRRILAVNDQDQLLEVNAVNGQQIMTFGDNGVVDLRAGLGRPVDQVGRIASGTPGRIFENLVIMGSAPGEEYGGAPGHIRAYDVHTGKMVWIFHTIPQEGEYGADQWTPEARKTAAAVNMWGGMAIDAKRGIAYIPLGSASYDFWGVDRPGTNLFSNSLVALDARTGKRLWHFQTVHHDLWDYDLTTTPTLMTVKHNGKDLDIVVQAGKVGFLYVFDRVTGKPLWPIEERPVPASTVPGEVASPTQPFPTVVPPFVKQSFGAEDVDTRLDPEEYWEIRNRVAAAQNEGLFTPPVIGRESVEMPGNNGGSNWGMSGAEPRSGRYYVAGYNYPTMQRLDKTVSGMGIGPSEGTPLDLGQAVYKKNCQACHGADRQGSPNAPELKGVSSRLSPEQVLDTIMRGRGDMPTFGKILSQDDIDNVTAFLTGVAPDRTAQRMQAMLAAQGGGAKAQPAPQAQYVPLRYHSPYGYLLTKRGTAGIKPPWNVLSAYDMNTGKRLWQAPVGVDPRYGFDIKTGTPALKTGMVITAGGLIFVPGGDKKLHAYDRDTGQELWAGDLPAPASGIPSSFSAGGRQFIVVPTGGGFGARNPAEKPGYVTFALPKRS